MSPSFSELLFWAAAACCAVAQLAILRALVLGRTPGAAPTRRAAEVLWSVLPALALAGLLVATWRAIHPPPAAGSPQGVRVLATPRAVTA